MIEYEQEESAFKARKEADGKVLFSNEKKLKINFVHDGGEQHRRNTLHTNS